MLAIGYDNGDARIYNVTNRRLLIDAKLPGSDTVQSIALAPKDNGLFVLGKKQLASWAFDPAYPEATFSSLFLPVWYEGYEKPGFRLAVVQRFRRF